LPMSAINVVLELNANHGTYNLLNGGSSQVMH